MRATSKPGFLHRVNYAWLSRLAMTAATVLSSQGLLAQAPQMQIPVPPPSSVSAVSAAAPSLKATKTESLSMPGKWYGSVELRHHLSTYHAEDGSYARQVPSMHARLQVGAQFYDGLLDAYGTIGVYKWSSTQQVLQRRPELALDFYPVRHEYVKLLQYNVVQLPFEQEVADPDAPDDVFDAGSNYMIGAALTLKLPMQAGATKWEPQMGFDAWTRVFSRKQYTSDYTDHRQELGDDLDEGRLGLSGNDQEGDTSPIEDRALHYDQQAMLGVAVTPGILPQATMELSGNYHSKFLPRYETYDSGSEYTYRVERYSYARFRLALEINERLSIANDFYAFKDGLFAGERPYEERRYRNIARITCRL